MTVPVLIKRLSETITVQFEFLDQMVFGETLSSPVVTVALDYGLDSSPSSIVTGVASVSGSIVSQKIFAGMPGVAYLLICTVNGSSGAVYKVIRRLAIVSNDGSFKPSSLPSLTGSLPDGVVGAAYSANLSISGGYLPYTAITPLPSAPTWMGYTVVGNNLTCAGTPGTDSLSTYTFSPRIQDAALNIAASAQTIDVTRTTIAGDLPNGEVNQTVNFNYTAANGTAPYTFTIVSGTLPTGLSMNSAGNVTGTFTTNGTFSWRVRATDVNGIFAELDDTCVVITYAFLTIPDTPTATNVFRSTSGTTWGDHIPCGLNTSGGSLFGGGQRLFVFASATLNGRVSSDGGATWGDISGINTTQMKNGMAYSPTSNAWIIALQGGTSVYRSTDSINFSPITVPSSTYYQGAAIGNTVIFNAPLGQLIRSTNGGLSFSALFSNGTGLVEHAITTPTCFLIAGTAGVLRSTTGASGTWTRTFLDYSVDGIAYGNGRVMIISVTGLSHYSDDDGVTWTAGPTIPNTFSTGGASTGNLAYGNFLFVAAGKDNFTGNIHSAIYSTPSSGVPAWTNRFRLLSGSQFEWISSAIIPDQG